MIVLHSFGPMFGLPDPSSFVLKTEVQLKMLGLAYRKAPSGLAGAPKGKIPYIEDEGQLIGDSYFIRAHLEKTRGMDLDQGLDGGQKALAWAVERMTEDHLYWLMVEARWMDDACFALGPAHFFDSAPEAMRDQLRAGAQKRMGEVLLHQGLGAHSRAELTDLAHRSFSAVATLLADKPYLTGETPCGADASLFGLIACVLTPYLPTWTREVVQAQPNLVAYRDRMMARYYPDFA